MHSRPLNNWAGRATAIASGLALIGGMSLVAVSPAAAAPGAYDESDVYASDIDASSTGGWQTQALGGANTVGIDSAGLQLAGTVGLLHDYSVDLGWTFWDMVDAGQVAWTATAGNVYFQVPVTFGSSSTVLQSAAASGTTTVSLSDTWKTSAAIGTTYAAGATASLQDLILAINDQGGTANVSGFGLIADGNPSTITGITWRDTNYTFHPEDRVPAGTVALSGNLTVGSVLTAETAGWPTGTTFSYEWFAAGENFGGPIDGATSASYTLTKAQAGLYVGVIITANKSGFGPNTARSVSKSTVTASAAAAAPAPVADSADLASYLASKNVTTQSQTSAGLPSGALNPDQDYRATLDWSAADGFVDVYLYSTPTLVGTFPVVNGAVQITLSAAVLSTLASGSHTLVAVGQTSGSVQSVALNIAEVLAATGVDAAAPIAIGSLLLLAGSALILARRRHVLA